MTHSFFVVMGGFALHDKHENIHRPIHPSQFISRLQAGDFLFPKMSEDEIKDKSKGDGLSKSIAVVQIMWFVTKLISRLKVGWEATDVEVLTLATCVVMLVVYGFWWYKPLNVQFQMELEPGPSSTASGSLSSEPGEAVSQMELDEEYSSVGTKPSVFFPPSEFCAGLTSPRIQNSILQEDISFKEKASTSFLPKDSNLERRHVNVRNPALRHLQPLRRLPFSSASHPPLPHILHRHIRLSNGLPPSCARLGRLRTAHRSPNLL